MKEYHQVVAYSVLCCAVLCRVAESLFHAAHVLHSEAVDCNADSLTTYVTNNPTARVCERGYLLQIPILLI